MERRTFLELVSSGLFVACIVPTDHAPAEPIWPQWVARLSDVEGDVPVGHSLLVVDPQSGQLWKLDREGWAKLRGLDR